MSATAAALHPSYVLAHNHLYAQHFVANDLHESQVNPDSLENSQRAISEVIIPSFTDSHVITPSIVASMTQQVSDRWVTWITSSPVNSRQLARLGVNASSLRIVHVKNHEDARWIIWQALSQGNSCKVIAEQAYFSEADIEEMEAAAKIGQCHGILIKTGRQ